MMIDDEKDYIMRIIKEMVRMLFSLLFGRKYSSIEVEKVNKYEVAGKTLDDFLDMADRGEINEAENILLDGLDYENKENVAAYLKAADKDLKVVAFKRFTLRAD